MSGPERFYFNPGGKGLEVFLGPTEAEIMGLAWGQESLTVKRAMFLLGEDDDRAYTTVMTVLARLAEKGLLRRERVGRNFVYRAAMSREEFLRERVGVIDRVLRANFNELL